MRTVGAPLSGAWLWGLILIAAATVSRSQETPAATAAATDTAGAAKAATDTVAVAQRDILDVLQEWIFHRRLEPEAQGEFGSGLAWSILPTLSYNPVYGLAFGAAFSGAGKRGLDPESKPSAISLSGNYSTTGQVQFQFRSDVFLGADNYLLRADVRYLDTDRSTWGLGPIGEGQQEYPMHFALVRVYGTVYRRTVGPAYIGLGYHYDEFSDIEDERAALGESTPFTTYSGAGVTHTKAAGISLNLLGDTRNSLVNPTEGYYLSGSFRDYIEPLGSERNWQEFWLDVRMYPHVPRQSNNVLAFWIYSWMSFGPAPYLGLPANGWDTQGRGARGYLQGRIRGQDQIYFETEYRMQLRRDGLLGAVGFFNLTATSLPETETFGRPDPGGGAGLRLKFNKRSNTNLAIDHAWGRDGSKGWFFAMTEVF